MAREWIEPMYDRTYGDVQNAQNNPDQESPKGCWNAEDLNRIENDTACCVDWMLKQLIIRTPPQMTVYDNYWEGTMIPSKSEIDRIINNVRLLIELSKRNLAIADQLPTIYASTQPNYVLANQIEYALDLMHNQPRIPGEKGLLRIVNGVIKSVTHPWDGTTEELNVSEAYIEEDDIVTIRGVEYGEYAQYQLFTYWSGEAEDLGLLNNYQAQETTFEMPFRDITFTANFKLHIPRTLTLNGGYISPNDDPTITSGPTTGTYYAGDQIMIIANVATGGKSFYCWTGTQAAIDNIAGASGEKHPSTAILTMPDCDVTLTSFYINAGLHTVKVNYGSGSGSYNYNDYVYISANDRTSERYQFSHWSGNTNYLSDIYSASQSFRMGDENIVLAANYVYMYSYNTVTMVNGYILIDGENKTQGTNLQQGSSQTLVPTPPDNTQGLAYWAVNGEGTVKNDILGNNINTFIVGDGDATLTGHYATKRTLTVNNVDNKGDTTTMIIVEGRRTRIDSWDHTGDYTFDHWDENGTVFTTNRYYEFTMPQRNLNLTAVYRDRAIYEVVINWGNHTTTMMIQDNAGGGLTGGPDDKGEEYSFLKWEATGNIGLIDAYVPNTGFRVNGPGTITATYVRNYYITINGSSATSGRYKPNNRIWVSGDRAEYGYEFSHWTVDSGPGTIDDIYSQSTWYRIKEGDGEITAHYKALPWFTVTMRNGYIKDRSGNWVASVRLARGATNEIKIQPGSVPVGHQFLQWNIYVNNVLQTNATDVVNVLAETTNLRNLIRDITIEATYYVPDDSIRYTLTIERKDGSVEQNDYPVGTDIQLYASSPDTGMKFYKWTGDTAFITGGRYNANSYLRMPERNVNIKETYIPEGYTPVYDLVLSNQYGQCETKNSTYGHSVWVSRATYSADSIVNIHTINIPMELYFTGWHAVNHDTQENADSIITSINSEATTIIMPDFDVDLEPGVAPRQLYKLDVIDGITSGNYYEGYRADIEFNKEDTQDIQYEFIRWETGPNSEVDISELEYEGTPFDPFEPEQQFISMPPHRVEVKAVFNTTYRLSLTNGTINETGLTTGMFSSGTTVAITADTPSEGMKFQYWSGNVTSLANKYDPTTTVTIANSPIVLTAVYSTDEDKNNIGYVTMSLKSVNTINNENIIVTSGEIDTGFIITDITGHVYIVTSIESESNISTIYRLTRIVKGGNIYE